MIFPAGILSNAEQIEPGGRAVTLGVRGHMYLAARERPKMLADFCEANGIANPKHLRGFLLNIRRIRIR